MRPFTLCIAVVFSALLISSCSKKAERTGAGVPVVVATVTERDVPIQIQALGKVEPLSTVAVKAQVGGEITRVHFQEGADVREGQVLFTIDPRPYMASLREAQSNLARDQSSAQNALAEARRAESLLASGIMSKEHHDRLQAEANAMEATVRADKAAVDRARLDLEFCTIRAPIGGRTGSVLVQRGNIVKAVDGSPLVIINRVDPIYVSFTVPEKRLREIQAARGARKLIVEVLVPGQQERPVRGELSFIDNSADQNSGTVRLKALFENKQRWLWPGQFVRANLVLGIRERATVVPLAAVQTGQAGTFAFVVGSDLKVETRAVVIDGESAGDAMVTHGLKLGERVVTDGQLRLVSGSKVEIKPAIGAGSPGPSPALLVPREYR